MFKLSQQIKSIIVNMDVVEYTNHILDQRVGELKEDNTMKMELPIHYVINSINQRKVGTYGYKIYTQSATWTF